MSDVERFLANAAQAERLAKGMPNDAHRQELLKIAAEWRKLADQATQRADDPSEPESP